jgi:hypothetical protein
MWHTSTDAEVIPGIRKRSIGSMILLVLMAENEEVESVKIIAPHISTGTHSLSGASSGEPADKVFVAGILVGRCFQQAGISVGAVFHEDRKHAKLINHGYA